MRKKSAYPPHSKTHPRTGTIIKIQLTQEQNRPFQAPTSRRCSHESNGRRGSPFSPRGPPATPGPLHSPEPETFLIITKVINRTHEK